MSLTVVATTSPAEDREPVVVEVVVPVYNEEGILEASVRRLRQYLDTRFPLPATIVIADNASTDGTWPVAARLGTELSGVRAVQATRQGRGLALRTAWTASRAAVVAYMDVDLSTDLDALLPLVAPLLSGHSDVAIGSRLAPGARVTRSLKREIISRTYNLILRAALGTRVSDAQCGFKALRGDVAGALLPLVADNSWFFDSELLAVAEHLGLRIHEVAVDWIEDTDSRVDILRTARDDLRGIWRLRHHLASVPQRRFAPRPVSLVAWRLPR
jgi:glycosyltransferase involved in cell wall biosynthesis